MDRDATPGFCAGEARITRTRLHRLACMRHSAGRESLLRPARLPFRHSPDQILQRNDLGANSTTSAEGRRGCTTSVDAHRQGGPAPACVRSLHRQKPGAGRSLHEPRGDAFIRRTMSRLEPVPGVPARYTRAPRPTLELPLLAPDEGAALARASPTATRSRDQRAPRLPRIHPQLAPGSLLVRRP